MAIRTLTINTRDGTQLDAWLCLPAKGRKPFPCVVMSHGFTALKAHGLDKFAQVFVKAGLACVVYEHRGFGKSGGKPRLENDPFQQMHDMRDVITWVSMRKELDPERIAVWGTSYSAGHALIVGAVDRRVKCVVAVVPVTSGSGTAKRLIGAQNWDERLNQIYAARRTELLTGETQYQQHTNSPETLGWFARVKPKWENRSSVVSHDMFMEYEPGDYIHRISPTPLLMVVADNDTRICTDLQLEAFARARDPKKLVMISGGHYEPYIEKFTETSTASRDWLVCHLIG